MSTEMDYSLLTTRQVAVLIGKSVVTVRRYANSGAIVPYRVCGSQMRFEPHDVEKLLILLEGGWKPSFKH